MVRKAAEAAKTTTNSGGGYCNADELVIRFYVCCSVWCARSLIHIYIFGVPVCACVCVFIFFMVEHLVESNKKKIFTRRTREKEAKYLLTISFKAKASKQRN